MLLLAGARAGWLGVVRANALQEAAATQQKDDIIVPARRGTITRRQRDELAVSQPAQTIAATPYLIKDARGGRREAREVLGDERGRAAQAARPARHRASSTSPARSRPGERCAPRSCTSRGSSSSRSTAASTRATGWPRSCSATSAPTAPGSPGSSTARTRRCAARDGERRLVRDALGETIELREDQRTVPGEQVRLTLDANIQDHAEEVLAAGRRGLAAQGRDRARDGPARRRHPRARQLAAGERQQALRGARLRDDEPRDGRHLRARLDVQGVHGRRRARGRQGHAERRRSASRRCCRSPTARSATPMRAAGRRATSRASSPSPPTSARR